MGKCADCKYFDHIDDPGASWQSYCTNPKHGAAAYYHETRAYPEFEWCCKFEKRIKRYRLRKSVTIDRAEGCCVDVHIGRYALQITARDAQRLFEEAPC